jgi:hypothetical protein
MKSPTLIWMLRVAVYSKGAFRRDEILRDRDRFVGVHDMDNAEGAEEPLNERRNVGVDDT